MSSPPNPKRVSADIAGRNTWYPYYAGFSPAFAQWAIRSVALPDDGLVVDPWNGGGTTTWAANSLGLRGWGGDLNPAMAVVAKAKLLDARNCEALGVLARRIVDDMPSADGEAEWGSDSLPALVGESDAKRLRLLERSINSHVVPAYTGSTLNARVSELSQIACFYYLALFRLARSLAKRAKASNPTWIRRRQSAPMAADNTATVEQQFLSIVSDLVGSAGISISSYEACRATVSVASSTALPLDAESADFILTSPPYCTRIDYAVATSIELAVLGASADQLNDLRRSLMGTTTVPKVADATDPRWGASCIEFLDRVLHHPSHASSVYYYKSHVEYFKQLYQSLEEIARVLKLGAHAVLVVQDSHYKDVHNDLALTTQQMARGLGLREISRHDFTKSRSMRALHPSRVQYGPKPAPVESVLFLKKTA